jgi:hypothetical protein
MVELNQALGLQLRNHPCQTEIGKFVIRVATTQITVDSSEPTLFEFFGRVG